MRDDAYAGATVGVVTLSIAFALAASAVACAACPLDSPLSTYVVIGSCALRPSAHPPALSTAVTNSMIEARLRRYLVDSFVIRRDRASEPSGRIPARSD